MNSIQLIPFFLTVSLFGLILPPYCASHWAHGPHMDHNPEVNYLSVESAKKSTLIIDSVQLFDFFSFMVIFNSF